MLFAGRLGFVGLGYFGLGYFGLSGPPPGPTDTAIPFLGFSAVAPRTIFTKRGPISRRAKTINSGFDLIILEPDVVESESWSFSSGNDFLKIQISESITGPTPYFGAPLVDRNSGTYTISEVISPTRVRLSDANLDVVDWNVVANDAIALANALKEKYESHRLSSRYHGTYDSVNIITAPDAEDVSSLVDLTNNLLQAVNDHSSTTGPSIPPVHSFADPGDQILLPPAGTDTYIKALTEAVLVLNAILRKFEDHRQDPWFHLEGDSFNRVLLRPVTTGPGDLVYAWNLIDEREGVIAISPSDVVVRVNGDEVEVDAVFGSLGAIVLAEAPVSGDSVEVDYRYIPDPPTRMVRLNSPEFALNQAGNHGRSGLPGHKYKQRCYLMNTRTAAADTLISYQLRPKHISTPLDYLRIVASPKAPQSVGWRYKGFERAYTAALNDPKSLVTNVPADTIAYPVLRRTVSAQTISYDPSSLPTSPWSVRGPADTSLDGRSLVVHQPEHDYSAGLSTTFSHPIDRSFPGTVSAVFRLSANEWTYAGVDSFSSIGAVGPSFGVTDGVVFFEAAFYESPAFDLGTAISLANDLLVRFNTHVVSGRFHLPPDTTNVVDLNPCSDLDSLIFLVNSELAAYVAHVGLGGPTMVHRIASVVPGLSEATDLDSAATLANGLAVALNEHGPDSSVHYEVDTVNEVPKVRSLIVRDRSKNTAQTAQHDWSVETTYRVHVDADGNGSLSIGGEQTPRIYVPAAEMALVSAYNDEFEFAQSVFFRTSSAAESTSSWRFVRGVVMPTDFSQIDGNKSVVYAPTDAPDQDPDFPWIVAGGHGTSIPGSRLIIESVGGTPPEPSTSVNRFLGFARLEPILSVNTTSSFEFTASVPFGSFGVDNRSAGVFVEDGVASVQLCFLQAKPVAASVTSPIVGTYGLNPGDSVTLSVDGGPRIVATTPIVVPTFQSATTIAAFVNSAVGSVCCGDDGTGRLSFFSPTRGSGSSVVLFAGAILDRSGISTGTYSGADSVTEPKVSWNRDVAPDAAAIPWTRNGGQTTRVLENSDLTISDQDPSDYLSFSISGPNYVGSAIPVGHDWKVGFRVGLSDVSSEQPVVSGPGNSFAGALVSCDEGPSGKNLELHLGLDPLSNPVVSIYSYDRLSDSLVYVSSWSYDWSGDPHSYNIFTAKGSDLITVFADGLLLGSFSYSSLKRGLYEPSLSFGSGGNSVSNADRPGVLSTSRWAYFYAFRDTTVSDPEAASNRYVGIFSGGDPSSLESYRLHRIDWRNEHTYRLVRDPSTSISLFVDGGEAPVLSSQYDVLSLPPSSSGLLPSEFPTRRLVAFGSFSESEIAKTSWGYIKYSLGRITVSGGYYPPRQTIRRANAFASPDHLMSPDSHPDHGRLSWSGGTPSDEFLADPANPTYTVLGPGTPPVPMSQDLRSRGGLVQTVTPLETYPSIDVVNVDGKLSSFENDGENAVSSPQVVGLSASVSNLVSDAAALRTTYLAHIVSAVHDNSDVVNNVVTVPVDLTTAVAAINDVATNLASHLSQATVHYNDRTAATPGTATDLGSAISLYSETAAVLDDHVGSYVSHVASTSIVDALRFDVLLGIVVVNSIRTRYSGHIANNGGAYHSAPDLGDIIISPEATNLVSAVTLANEIKAKYNSHRTHPGTHQNDDVVNVVTAPDATTGDVISLFNLLTDIQNVYAPHIGDGAFVHFSADTTNVVTGLDTDEWLVAGLEAARGLLNVHSKNTTDHVPGTFADTSHLVLGKLRFSGSGTSTSAIQSDYLRLVPEVAAAFAAHATDGSHLTDDFVSADLANAILASPPIDFTSAMIESVVLLQQIFAHAATAPNPLFVPFLPAQVLSHSSTDFVNSAPDGTAVDPLPASIALANDLLANAERHVLRKQSHVAIGDTGFADLIPATDAASLIVLANGLAAAYESHREFPGRHVRDDLVNVVTSPEATNLSTAINLVNDVAAMYEAHRVLDGVHSSVVTIRLDPPEGVLYDKTKFYQFPSGSPGQLAPYSDDEMLLDGPGSIKVEIYDTLTLTTTVIFY